MHRVELKVFQDAGGVSTRPRVPNAPCGVESSMDGRIFDTGEAFLMHRVELKGCKHALPCPRLSIRS